MLALILLIENASLKFLLDMHFCRQTCLLKPEFSKMKFRIKDVVQGGREEATFFVSVKVKMKKTYLLLGAPLRKVYNYSVAPCSYSAEHL